jgi:endoglycosylceramidase
LTALTLAAALAAPRPATAGAGVTAGPGRWFKDAGGRTLILRGVNIAADAKLPNFQPVTDLAALDALPARGVSVVRLLFTWEAYEPAPGAYDGAYMAYIKSIVAHLHSLGVLTIVDMHQDAYARSLGKGCGDGFPGWAVPAAAAAARSLQPTPPPAANTAANAGTKRCASWLLAALLDVPTGMAWKGFYEDEGGARSAFVAVWARVRRERGEREREREDVRRGGQNPKTHASVDPNQPPSPRPFHVRSPPPWPLNPASSATTS